MKPGKTFGKILFFLGLSLPLLALITIGWLVRETSGRFQQSFFQVEHTYKVVNLVEQTQLHLLDAETERRGYLLAGGADYLSSYGTAMTAIQKDIDQLQVLVGKSNTQQTNMLQLQDLINVRLGIGADKMKSGGNLPDVLAVSLTAEGKKTMDEVNRVLFEMREEEEAQLNEREQRTQDDAISGQVATVILIGTVAVALIFIVFILVRLEKLQQFVTICAWTGQVKDGNDWIRLDEYLQRRFGLSVSHGVSREAAIKMMHEMEARPNNASK
ncbi:MAG TPA: CHASE3 domain-containing protein [Candidatus Acidoferrum sp.]|jgi:methyl-accepting chemotaxis protein|nr:CHASE3 domain-containing protein [Candidatus Acidoferrum sp.]